MLGSQPKLSSVVESSVSWDLFLGCYRQDFDCDNNLNGHLKKAAKIWGRQHWFLRKMTFENDCRNFILATSCVTTQIWVVLLIAIFPSLMTNQKHYPELGIGTSTVWNFCSHFSDVILQGNQRWCWKMSAVFLKLSCSVQLMQGCHAAGCSHVGWHRPQCRLKQLLFSQRPVYMETSYHE